MYADVWVSSLIFFFLCCIGTRFLCDFAEQKFLGSASGVDGLLEENTRLEQELELLEQKSVSNKDHTISLYLRGLDIHHNLLVTLLLGFKTENMLVKQVCYVQTKMYKLYRIMTIYWHFSL